MNAIFKIGLLLPLLFWQTLSIAQVQAEARLDTNALLIGDQTGLEISFSCPAGYTVHWPMIEDTITREIEVLKHSTLESIPGNDQTTMLYRQSYTVTSFDSGYFVVPPILIGYKTPGDTTLYFAETEALLLQVNTVPVNMEAEIKDIKGPMRAPFTFREALPYILIFLGIVLVGFLIYYYIQKRRKAEPIFRAPAARKIPADQQAMEALDTLRYKKLWQSGEIKQYHTELTDILREYLWANFQIQAHEYTTDEIMTAINRTPANLQAKEKLNQTLILADMVKFAKMQPLPLEHDGSLNNAVDFVKETRHLYSGPDQNEESVQAETDEVNLSFPVNKPLKEEITAVGGKEVNDVE